MEKTKRNADKGAEESAPKKRAGNPAGSQGSTTDGTSQGSVPVPIAVASSVSDAQRESTRGDSAGGTAPPPGAGDSGNQSSGAVSSDGNNDQTLSAGGTVVQQRGVQEDSDVEMDEGVSQTSEGAVNRSGTIGHLYGYQEGQPTRLEIIQSARQVEFKALPCHMTREVKAWKTNVYAAKATGQLDKMQWSELFAKDVFEEVEDSFISRGWLGEDQDDSWKGWSIESLLNRVTQTCPDAPKVSAEGEDNELVEIQEWVDELKMNHIKGLGDLREVHVALTECHTHICSMRDNAKDDGELVYVMVSAFLKKLAGCGSKNLASIGTSWKAACKKDNKAHTWSWTIAAGSSKIKSRK